MWGYINSWQGSHFSGDPMYLYLFPSVDFKQYSQLHEMHSASLQRTAMIKISSHCMYCISSSSLWGRKSFPFCYFDWMFLFNLLKLDSIFFQSELFLMYFDLPKQRKANVTPYWVYSFSSNGCCLNLVILVLHLFKTILPRAWNILQSPFSRLWLLKI